MYKGGCDDDARPEVFGNKKGPFRHLHTFVSVGIHWENRAYSRAHPYYEDGSNTETDVAVVIVASIACGCNDLLASLARYQVEGVVDCSHGGLVVDNGPGGEAELWVGGSGDFMIR